MYYENLSAEKQSLVTFYAGLQLEIQKWKIKNNFTNKSNLIEKTISELISGFEQIKEEIAQLLFDKPKFEKRLIKLYSKRSDQTFIKNYVNSYVYADSTTDY